MITSNELIDYYKMQSHPEGGFYVETFRSLIEIQTQYGLRSASTAIYFLMNTNNVSRFHKIKSDEVWHFYLGLPITIVEIDNNTGLIKKTILGTNINNHENLQYVVKADTWFGSYPNIPDIIVDELGNNNSQIDNYSLVGCTVSPGFDFIDFELASRATLFEQYPFADKDIIIKLTNGLL